MVKDSVREELALKISPIAKGVRKETKEKSSPPVVENLSPPKAVPTPPIVSNPHTSEITAKPTSPTLVEFHNKNAIVPDWRLQLQNSVRRRNDRVQTNEETPAPVNAPQRAPLVTSGATALQSEVVENIEPIHSSNPKLENALRRIEASRQKYLAEEISSGGLASAPQPKTFPFVIANKTPDFPSKNSGAESGQNLTVKPKPASSLAEAKAEKFDTNKLPPLPIPAKFSSSFEKLPVVAKPEEIKIEEENKFLKPANADSDVLEEPQFEETDNEEFDDCAPVSLRFNAGLFDLIIGSFVSFLLLSPFLLSNGQLFTLEGFLAFLAICLVVMFVYLTVTIGLMGKTFGMRLFSLEVIDVEENDYPTMHQAAVSSSVYLLSLAFGGIGFLTFFLNDEKRAAHDLLSGTMVVKEY